MNKSFNKALKKAKSISKKNSSTKKRKAINGWFKLINLALNGKG